MSMMMGVAFSLGDVSTRITPSIGPGLPRWAVMSLSAGNDIGTALLCDNGILHGRVAEKVCEWWYFVGRTLDADDRWAVDRERSLQLPRQILDGEDVGGLQAGEHGAQAGAEPA